MPFANHSEFKTLLKLDLQFFAEGEEDYILPDDFVTDLPQSDEVIQEEFIEPQDTTNLEADTNESDLVEKDLNNQQDLTEQQMSELQKIRVKFNHEEQEIPIDEAVPLIQKGMNYDKLQERYQALEKDPRLIFVEQMAQEQGMTTEQYLEAVKEAREQRQLNELIQQNIPEEYAREMLENRKFRQQLEAEKKAKQQEETNKKQFGEFFEYFQQANGRAFDPNKDQLPQEVWEVHSQGVPLKFAYMEHQNKELKSQLQTLEQNKQNQQRAPIQSVTQFGSNEPTSEDPFLKGFESI